MNSSMNSILFNVAGGAVLLTVVGYMATSYIVTPKVAPCTSRMPAGMQMTYDKADGSPLSGIELQARSGAREWGLTKNAKVVDGRSQPGSGNLEVTLAPIDEEEGTTQNGVGFTWQPHEITSATAACLSYRVYLPDGFVFTEPGYLPGLFGASDVTQIDELQPDDSFVMRMGWGQAGDVGVDVRIPTSAGYWEGARYKTIWPTGRWVNIEQEVRLNTPGQDDGMLRVWVDGALTIDSVGLPLRKTAQSVLTGVVADIGFARTLSAVSAVKISPFIIQWQ